jgi:sugar (pentulose or hexulose) kinase
MDECILSLDLGTTAIKVALIDRAGRIIATSTQEYRLLTPDTLSVELPVETYWAAFKRGLEEALARGGVPAASLRCMGISAQGETLILLDKSGSPLRNAIVWMDNRAQREAEELNGRFGSDLVYATTGQVSIVPTWPASKLLWVRRNEPALFEKIDKVLLIEDYFIYRLTGQFVCEGSLICSTAYWDINTKRWWKDMLRYLEIDERQLPEIREPGTRVGKVSAAAAGELGLPSGMEICTGALDQAAGAIGVGNIRPGLFSENTGAALAICATVDRSFTDPARQMPCHYHGVPGMYMAHTFTTGGMVMKWFRDGFCSEEISLARSTGMDAYDLMGMQAARVAPGSDGLIMLPHLSGAMAPEANPKAKGVFYGATLRHAKGHFIRSIMEAIGFIVMRNVKAVEAMGIEVGEIRVLGGGSRSDIWNQIKADITGRVVVTTEYADAACLGAAILCGSAVGVFDSLEGAVAGMVNLKRKFVPDPANHRVYEGQFDRYLALYESLCPLFERFDR